MGHKSAYFFYFIGGLFLLLVGPKLFADGMFLDGVTYAAISNNLAEGLGSFWKLYYTATLYPEFYEHPPLALWLEGYLHFVFGSSIYVERCYSFFTAILTGFMIVLIWRQLGQAWTLAWVPLLLWLLFPKVSWSYSNNMLENTMGVFLCASVFFYLKSLTERRALYILLASFALIFGFLSKGLVAFFILSAPLWFWAIMHKETWSRAFIDIGAIFMGFVGFLALLFWIVPDSLNGLGMYFQFQVLHSLSDVITVNNRFRIIKDFFNESIINFVIIVISIGVFYVKSKSLLVFKPYLRTAVAFIALGLSGVIPIMISMKQSSYYIVPAFPFFAMGYSILLVPVASQVYKYIMDREAFTRALRIIALSLCIGAIGITVYKSQTFGRDEEKLTMIYQFSKSIPPRTIIDMEPELKEDWGLHAYFMRYGSVSLDAKSFPQRTFYLCRNSEAMTDSTYLKVDESNGYYLFKRQ